MGVSLARGCARLATHLPATRLTEWCQDARRNLEGSSKAVRGGDLGLLRARRAVFSQYRSRILATGRRLWAATRFTQSPGRQPRSPRSIPGGSRAGGYGRCADVAPLATAGLFLRRTYRDQDRLNSLSLPDQGGATTPNTRPSADPVGHFFTPFPILSSLRPSSFGVVTGSPQPRRATPPRHSRSTG
jgi:hypothetical protein